MNRKNNARWNLMAAICIFFSCSTVKQPAKIENMPGKTTDTVKTSPKPAGFLETLLKSYPQYFGELLKNAGGHNLQVIYTQVNRSANGSASLQHHYFNTDPANYFYPASTVKLPVALLALQKLNELKDRGIDRNTTILTETGFSGQTAVFNDPTSTDGRPTIAQYIKKILLVSDNDAYNRLYEFLGQDYINTALHKKGYTHAQVLHRLEVFLTEEENRNTNPVKFYDGSNRLLYEQAAQRNAKKYAAREDSLGTGYYRAGKLISGAMDFSKKNRISLQELHQVLVGLVFPDNVPASSRFNITEDDRQFVLKYMSMYPTESKNPSYAYDTANYWPAMCKFLLLGKQKTAPPASTRIFNKVGDAYGHLVDVAYVVDHKNKIEFFLSAVIYCNSDGILNDDKYDYANTGIPFMKNLGQVIYDYELKREYKIKPNLAPFLFTYD